MPLLSPSQDCSSDSQPGQVFNESVCVYVCTYVRTYVYMYVWMAGCMYVWMDVCMDGWMYVWMYVCMDVWMYFTCRTSLASLPIVHINAARNGLQHLQHWKLQGQKKNNFNLSASEKNPCLGWLFMSTLRTSLEELEAFVFSSPVKPSTVALHSDAESSSQTLPSRVSASAMLCASEWEWWQRS